MKKLIILITFLSIGCKEDVPVFDKYFRGTIDGMPFVAGNFAAGGAGVGTNFEAQVYDSLPDGNRYAMYLRIQKPIELGTYPISYASPLPPTIESFFGINGRDMDKELSFEHKGVEGSVTIDEILLRTFETGVKEYTLKGFFETTAIFLRGPDNIKDTLYVQGEFMVPVTGFVNGHLWQEPMPGKLDN